MLKYRWRILLKSIDLQFKNVTELVSTCLVVHNICIIIGDNFWNSEWLQESSYEVHNGLSFMTPSVSAKQEKLAVANHVLHSLAGIENKSRETLEYFKQENAREFQISMTLEVKLQKSCLQGKMTLPRVCGWLKEESVWQKHFPWKLTSLA